jgi:hypothetical protein
MNAQPALSEIIIPARRSRVPIPFLIGLPASAFFLYLYITDDKTLPFFYLRAFYLVLFVYALTVTIVSLLDYIKTVFDKNARLIISDTTLNDQLSILSCGEIPWDDVTEVSIRRLKRFNIQFLVITLKDDEKYLKNKHPVLRFFLKKYIRTYGGIILISENRIHYDIQQLKEDISARFRR